MAVLVQPRDGLSMTAHSMASSPVVQSRVPGTSMDSGRPDRESGTTSRASTTASAARGMFTRKAARQEYWATSHSPITGPVSPPLSLGSQGGGEGADDEAGEERPAAAEAVGGCAGCQDESAEDEGVAVDDPLQLLHRADRSLLRSGRATFRMARSMPRRNRPRHRVRVAARRRTGAVRAVTCPPDGCWVLMARLRSAWRRAGLC
ncbi:hypothetical protein CK936_11650 [Streptomyces albireticuli]|uniref:Uncharacterized protein n=1 Tax=Streptomyces albireticuli TaxID=1940 RepID=A0A2A2DBM3_9ACTN|nr:hypothetical protein CK936_11650 [Streptomyces albireticuli]